MWDGDKLSYKQPLQEKARVQDLNEAIDDLKGDFEQFAYVVSHDLQEPLRMVSAFTELLQKRYHGQLDEQAQEYIFFAADGAQRMQTMIAGLLEYSRISTQGKAFDKVDLNQSLGHAKNRLSKLLSRNGVTLEAETLPEVYSDRSQMITLLFNLLHNALYYNRHQEELTVKISAVQSEHNWTLLVQDNGAAIPQSVRQSLFVIFRGHEDIALYKSQGMGLAIAKRIVQRHGGQIGLKQDYLDGNCFYFSLPITQKAEEFSQDEMST